MESKLKYIFLSDGYRGGASQFLNDHSNYLAKKNKDVILLDPNPQKTFEKLHKKIKVKKININDCNAKNKKILNDLINTKKKNSFLIISNFVFLIKYFLILSKFRKNNKIILTVHSGRLKKNFKFILLDFIFSLISKNVDFLIFGSHSAKRWWTNNFPWMGFQDLSVKYNGIKLPNNQKIKKLKKPFQISFVGRVEEENNLKFFIDIAEEILKKSDNFRFNIFGDGPELKNFRSNFSKKCIKFHGWTKKDKIYKITDILIITAPINNFPYVALEAKSFGIPVLSCSRGDISKIIKNGIDGYIVDTNSIYIMINLINKIINKYKDFSTNSIKRSKLYDLENSCKKFWKYIE